MPRQTIVQKKALRDANDKLDIIYANLAYAQDDVRVLEAKLAQAQEDVRTQEAKIELAQNKRDRSRNHSCDYSRDHMNNRMHNCANNRAINHANNLYPAQNTNEDICTFSYENQGCDTNNHTVLCPYKPVYAAASVEPTSQMPLLSQHEIVAMAYKARNAIIDQDTR